MEGGEEEGRVIAIGRGRENSVHCSRHSHTCTSMYVCLMHTYTTIPVALSIMQGGLGVKGPKDIHIFWGEDGELVDGRVHIWE